MAKKKYVIHNKSSKPNNVVARESELMEQCASIELTLPSFLRDFFIYLKGSVAITTRHAYLSDIKFFFDYLVNETRLVQGTTAKDITVEEIAVIKSRDVNRFLGDYCRYYYSIQGDTTYIMENNNRALSRKKSSLSVLFKFLFREELIPDNITDGFNPIKLPKPQPDAIKRLAIDEVQIMLDAVEKGDGLTDKERSYWLKTKLRDKAILVLFTTYGLRLKELQQLNISSFNFSRGEFKIYRKRGKEVLMPINKTAEKVVMDYVENERPNSKRLAEEHKDALFLSLQNRRMTERAIQKLVKKYTSIAMNTPRDKGYSPHKLRATAATSLIEYGFSIYDVQNLMDHDNITTTQLYAAHRRHAKRDLLKNYELLDEDEKKKD